MRVLFLSPDYIIPTNRGLRVRVYSQLRLLSAMDQVESISFLSLSTAAVTVEDQHALERQIPKVHVETPVIRDTYIRRSRRAMLRFLHRRFLRNEPYLIATHDVPELHVLVDRHLRDQHYDIIYFGYLGMMAYYGHARKHAPRATLILEQHNLEWQIFARLAEKLSPPLRQLAQVEAYALKRRERIALRQVDSVVSISDADKRQFRDLAGIDAIVVPPYIEPLSHHAEQTDEPHIGYIGHLAWQPNVYGLDWFCREVWPLVRGQIKDARLTIAGPGLQTNTSGTLEVPQAWQCPGITTVGFVTDLNELYSATLGMIAPVVGGSGVRMKILETLSAGMPTITTSDGAAGLDVGHGRELLIADDAIEFADCVVRILEDRGLREQLRRGGYEYLELHHSHSVTKGKLEGALNVPKTSRNSRLQFFNSR